MSSSWYIVFETDIQTGWGRGSGEGGEGEGGY